MKVRNMTSSSGNKVANQFIITENEDRMSGNCTEYFQSYDSIIAKREPFSAGERDRKVTLDISKWDYSKTTGKYRNRFLGETKAETERKIKAGIYELANLN